jgi:phage N-6-adenine-methyltransferase
MTFCEPLSKGSTVETPPEIFDPLNAEFHFQRDVCATPENAKCPAFWSINDGDDALTKEWSGVLWMNPPYGREIGKFVQKAYDSACAGYATVVCLLPARSDNEWWKLVIQSELRFIRGRIRFVGTPGSCMFPCCVAIFHAHLDPGGIMKVWKP